MKKFLIIISSIAGAIAYLFFMLFKNEQFKNKVAIIEKAEKEADKKAEERHGKIKDNNLDMASDIADIIDK